MWGIFGRVAAAREPIRAARAIGEETLAALGS
jgi:hypothetical protein